MPSRAPSRILTRTPPWPWDAHAVSVCCVRAVRVIRCCDQPPTPSGLHRDRGLRARRGPQGPGRRRQGAPGLGGQGAALSDPANSYDESYGQPPTFNFPFLCFSLFLSFLRGPWTISRVFLALRHPITRRVPHSIYLVSHACWVVRCLQSDVTLDFRLQIREGHRTADRPGLQAERLRLRHSAAPRPVLCLRRQRLELRTLGLGLLWAIPLLPVCAILGYVEQGSSFFVFLLLYFNLTGYWGFCPVHILIYR